MIGGDAYVPAAPPFGTASGDRAQSTRARIESEDGNPSATLLAGWLRTRLGADVQLDEMCELAL